MNIIKEFTYIQGQKNEYSNVKKREDARPWGGGGGGGFVLLQFQVSMYSNKGLVYTFKYRHLFQ